MTYILIIYIWQACLLGRKRHPIFLTENIDIGKSLMEWHLPLKMSKIYFSSKKLN
jgi:hypothetical protein